MALSPGTRIGSYEVLEPLGRGGMGEVWRARDSRLRREVAIKALPEALSKDPDRRARLEREARLLASLSHPNVAAIYGLEETDGAAYLVLELVAGRTLADRLAAGMPPLPETLAIAEEIAAGLEAAHQAGIIHRDLKPGNVIVRADGKVKVLDFGLARVVEAPAAASEVSDSPTLTSDGTGAGVILGTAAYMSPEQARGKPLDRRTDVFSFGAVLYECLTGRKAFPGGTVSDTLVAVISLEPDWDALRRHGSQRLVSLLRRCLQKDPERRLRDIGDARLEIEEIRAELASGATGATRAAGYPAAADGRRRLAAVAALAGLVLGATAAWLLGRRGTAPSHVAERVQAILPLPAGVTLSTPIRPSLAVSPDGRTLVFRATSAGRSRLYRRALDSDVAEPLPGTEGGGDPFFSPDGQWLGFFTVSSLEKVPVGGGSRVRIADVPPVAQGAAWLADGFIVFNRAANAGLFRVAAGGGAISPLVDLDPARGEHAILWPQELPGGKGLLAIVVRGRDFQDIASAEAVVLEPGSWKRRVVLEGCSFARYLPGGYILFLRGSSLFVVGFDARRLEVVGAPQRVSEPITVLEGWQTPHFAVSKDGTLFYASGPPVRQTRNRLVSLDEAGRPTPLPLPPGRNGHPKLSPDGKRIVVARYEGSTLKLSVFERDRQVLSALTPEPGRTFCPAWSPDGRQVAYSFFHQSHPRLAIKAADGSGERRHPTPRTEDAEFVNSWSPDDQWIAYTLSYNEDRGGTRQRGTSDIWLLSLEELKARPWFETPFREIGAEFSPDGRWIAYVSDETGRNEVYVRPFPGPGGRLKVSAEGGNEPTWWKGGREVLFRKDDAFLTAEFRPGTEASAGAPRPLFEARLDRGGREDFPRQYDVARDGSEIIAVESDPEQPVERQLAIVTGWTSGVARGQKSK